MSISERIGEFVTDLDFATLPLDVTRMVKMAILDHVGCAIGGVQTSLAKRVLLALNPAAGNGPSTLLSDGRKIAPRDAALLNGHFANCLDFDETYLDLGHPGTAIIPAAIAVAEAEQASGAEFLAAVAAGYEVAIRLALATRPSGERLGIVSPAIWHGIGAAVACARLMRLDAKAVRSAISLGMELAPGPALRTAETVHAFKAGKIGYYAGAGVDAATLARLGCDGKQTLLDEVTPFWLAWGSDRCDYEIIHSALGTKWLLLDLSFKPYPACRLTHSAIDAVREVRVDHQPDIEAIRGIELHTFASAMRLSNPRPARFEQGPFCMPYVTALGLLDVPPGPQWFSDETLQDPGVLNLGTKIEMYVDAHFEENAAQYGRLPSRVVVHLSDGETLVSTVEVPRGDPTRPLNETELRQKFMGLASPVIGHRVDELVDCIGALEEIDSIRQLTGLIA